MSILDRLGPWYTLIRFDPNVDVQPLVDTGLPFVVIDAKRPLDAAFRHRLVMVRADAHVVWRGDELPSDIADLAERMRGRHGAGQE